MIRPKSRQSLADIIKSARRDENGSVTISDGLKPRHFEPHPNGGGLVERGVIVPPTVVVHKDAIVKQGTRIPQGVSVVRPDGLTYASQEYDS